MSSNNDYIKERSEAQKQLTRDIFTTFSTPQGKKVLKHLEDITLYKETFGQTGDGVQTALVLARRSGENNIIHYIKSQIEKGKEKQ